MKIIQLIQGTPEWHAHRAQHFNASDAPAMLGCSPYKTRTQLVREIATGVSGEVNDATQARFDDGHRAEALARPLAEQIVGEDLFPCVGVSDDGPYSASFDGLTLMENMGFEHKSLNDDLRAVFTDIQTMAPKYRDTASASNLLPKVYRVQMEQQCMVSGAEKVLFMASKWNGDTLIEEHHCWYYPDQKLRTEIVAGWEQFSADVAAYQPEPEAAPVAAGRAPETLPALRVEVTGMVTASNLADFKAQALAVLGGINRELQTDEDFANAEQTVKWCQGVEDRLAATKDHVLSQTADIELVFRTMDEVSAETRRIRLELDKLVTKEKDNRKLAIVSRARDAYMKHVEDLKAETNGAWIALQQPDFGVAIKGKRTLSSMQDAVDTVLASGKIAANESAKQIRAALACLAEETKGHEHLFPDALTFIGKPVDDIKALVRGRIAEHKQREDERLDQERERIRQEEVARLEREAAATAEQDTPKGVEASAAAEPATQPANPAPIQTGAARLPVGARMKLGDINAWIAPLSITADGLASLGFKQVGTERSAKLYADNDFPRICQKLTEVLAQAPARAASKEAA